MSENLERKRKAGPRPKKSSAPGLPRGGRNRAAVKPEAIRDIGGEALRLPNALSGERVSIETAAGRIAYYHAAPAVKPRASRSRRPLLLVHSINAAGSAFEVKPLFEHYRHERAVYALDLPGFGASERSDRVYTPRLMTDALIAMLDEIALNHGDHPIDALAVSLSCEFLARAAAEKKGASFRSLALISPTGFSGRKPQAYGPPGSTRGITLLRRVLSLPLLDDALYGLLTRPATIRYFLERTWGDSSIDEELWQYAVLSTRLPGAKHAPLYFLSADLFSKDINRLYDSLGMPVWLAHGIRGDFVDYRGVSMMKSRKNWHLKEFPTGALPYFEAKDEFVAAYTMFLMK